jgi:uridine kinase
MRVGRFKEFLGPAVMIVGTTGGGGGVTTFHSKLRVKLSGTDQSYVTVIVLIT